MDWGPLAWGKGDGERGLGKRGKAFFQDGENVPGLGMVKVAPLCEYAEKHLTAHFLRRNFKVC